MRKRKDERGEVVVGCGCCVSGWGEGLREERRRRRGEMERGKRYM